MSGSIDDLRLFVEVVQAGSLAAAARRLDSSAPVMTRRVASIEKRLGVKLLVRNSRRFMLTDEGAYLYERAVNIVKDIEDAEAQTIARTDAPGGLLKIGAPTELGRRVIAPLLADFRASCPNVEVLLVLSDAGLNPLDDDLDMVLRNGMPEAPMVVVRKLLSSRRLVCATPQYIERNGAPLVPDDLLRHDCIRLVRGRRFFDHWPFFENGQRRLVSVKGTLASTSGEVVHDWILGSMGIGLKALWDVHADLRSGRLVECLQDYWCDEINLYAVYPSHAHIPRRCRAFTDYLVAALPK